MRTIRIIIFLICTVFSQLLIAQNVHLSDEEKNEFQIRIKQKIDDFQGHLTTIASKGISEANKAIATKSALSLFIGKGQKYEYYDEYNNRKWHEPVMMQVSSARTGRVYNRLLTSYLSSLRNMTIYTKVIIESADAVRVDNINETSDGKYEAVAYFCQKFCGYKDGRLIYNDYVEKKVKVYIEKELVPSPDGNIIRWRISLGDIYVVNTSR